VLSRAGSWASTALMRAMRNVTYLPAQGAVALLSLVRYFKIVKLIHDVKE